jgi:GTP cyclohydrolase III
MSEDPDDRWVWVIDKLDDDRHPECVAIGIERTASDALQEAERALHLREHGVTPDVTEYRRAT